MAKKIILKLKSINYSGSSIGDDIKLEINILGKLFSIKKKIKVGTKKEFDKIIREIDSDSQIFEADIGIRIIEEDSIFNDMGILETRIKIDTNKNSQEFTYEVLVSELRVNLSKAKAIFKIILQVEILEAEIYLPETSDGWLMVKIKGIAKEKSLPSFLRVYLTRSSSSRDYFEILEGFYMGKSASIRKKSDGTSYLQRGILLRKSVELLYSISKKSFILEEEEYYIDDDPSNLFNVGVYDIEIPDAPHELGRQYLDRSKFALVWFHIGHDSRDDRFLHTGTVSLGCVSMREIEKWDVVCKKLLIVRKDDGVSVGVLRVIS